MKVKDITQPWKNCMTHSLQNECKCQNRSQECMKYLGTEMCVQLHQGPSHNPIGLHTLSTTTTPLKCTLSFHVTTHSQNLWRQWKEKALWSTVIWGATCPLRECHIWQGYLQQHPCTKLVTRIDTPILPQRDTASIMHILCSTYHNLV